MDGQRAAAVIYRTLRHGRLQDSFVFEGHICSSDAVRCGVCKRHCAQVYSSKDFSRQGMALHKVFFARFGVYWKTF